MVYKVFAHSIQFDPHNALERGRQGGHLQVYLAEEEADAQTDGMLFPELTLLARP